MFEGVRGKQVQGCLQRLHQLPGIKSITQVDEPKRAIQNFEGQLWPSGVDLSRLLVRVHAVAQTQLGPTTAVLTTEVVGDGTVVLGSVGKCLVKNV